MMLVVRRLVLLRTKLKDVGVGEAAVVDCYSALWDIYLLSPVSELCCFVVKLVRHLASPAIHFSPTSSP